MRNVECGMRNGCGTLDALAPARSPHVNSALRIPHSQFESCDPGFLAQRASDLIRSREQHLPAVRLHGERGAEPEAVVHALLFQVDGELILSACGLMAAEQLGDLLGQEAHGHEPVLTAVREKDVGERRRQDRAEAVLAERPDRVFARRAAAEVLPGEEDARAPGVGVVELEVRVRTTVGPEAPVVEQGGSEPGAFHPLEELLRNDLVGIHVGARQGRQPTGVTHEGFHHGAAPPAPHLRTSTMCPATAAAAAMGGLMRWVRPPRPCRPSKLRFDVEAQRSPPCSTSGFMPRHMEQPALRHSNPASLNTRSSPSRSACAFTCCDPGTTMARTPVATCRPRTVRAAARRSSIRALVQDPRNTRSIGSPSSGVPGASPMYSSARVTARRSASVGKSAGLGTQPVTGVTMPGLVPQVTWGATSAASSWTCLSYVAPGSVRSSRHRSTARSHAAPLGARGRPLRYATVFSSGAIMPARAPASIDMLHTVIRSSIESARIASPVYSMTWPVAPAVPIRPIRARIKSLAVTPGASPPVTRASMVPGFDHTRHCVASTCSTSLVPIPRASAPKAPWVAVCESPHTITMPGWVRPSSGPITCTIPCCGDRRSNSSSPKSRALTASASSCRAAIGSAIGAARSPVGTLWSTVATVSAGRRTLRPACRKPSNACGDVTSCTRCRSTYSSAGPSGN